MGIIQRVTTWYFSKNALPYWCVLLLDCAIIVFAGMLGTYFVQGGTPLQGDGFWHFLLVITCFSLHSFNIITLFIIFILIFIVFYIYLHNTYFFVV